MEDVFDEEKKGFSIASLVLGIVGLLSSCFFVGIICGALAIIFGALSLRKKQGIKGMAIAGLILGIVSIALTLILIICVGISVASILALAGIH